MNSVKIPDPFDEKVAAAYVSADEKHLALARLFQLAASQDEPQKIESLRDSFIPHPVYLFQALAFSSNEALRKKVCLALNALWEV